MVDGRFTLTGEQTMDPDNELRSKVELHEEPGERGSWEEQKGIGCKYFRNVATSGYLGRRGSTNPNNETV